MTDSNRVRIAYVAEATAGTTPAVTVAGTATSNYRTARITGESLNFSIDNIQSQELRADRKVADLIQVGARNQGDINFELSYPQQETYLGDHLAAAMFQSDWTNTYERWNTASGTPIVSITLTTTFTVNSTTGVVANSLVKTEGFTNAGNNIVFKPTSVTGTTIVTSGLTNETPPAGARIKVVGAEGASSDITVTATGLGSTTLNFTTLGLAVGMWIKIGGTAAGTKYNTAANNTFCRITAIAANALTLDNRPSGWAVDAGTSKTIRLFWGDYIRDGITPKFFTIEKGYLGQTSPAYLDYTGMHIGQMNLSYAAGQIITGSFGYLGFTHTADTTPLDGAGPVAATSASVMNATSNVGRVAEAGTIVAGPNYIRDLSLSVNNNLRERTAIGTLGLIGVGSGQALITGNITTYFGDLTLYNKYLAGTQTSLNVRTEINNQAVIITLPKVEFSGGGAPAQGINQDVTVNLPFQAILDTVTNCQMQLDRIYYYEV